MITISINGASPISVPWTPNLTVHQAMETAYNQTQNRQVFSFAIDYYGSFQPLPYGYMVIMMNGTYDLPSTQAYWALLVNGVYASRGIDYVYLNDGDAVQFNNVVYAEAEHRGTTVEIKHQAFLAS